MDRSSRQRRRIEPVTYDRTNRGARSFQDVLGFTWRHWRRHTLLTAATSAALIGATVADVLMPIFAGRLVDAMGVIAADRDTSRRAALAALAALGAIAAFGLVMIVLRHLARLLARSDGIGLLRFARDDGELAMTGNLQ